jgi:hypothetical protein
MKPILPVFLILTMALLACGPLIPERIEQEASWIALENQHWHAVWKDSFRLQEAYLILGTEVTVDTTSRATAWTTQTHPTGVLAFSTPNITLHGFSLNPFSRQNTEWILRELAGRAGEIAQQELQLGFNLSTVPISLQHTMPVHTATGLVFESSTFLAETQEGDWYVTVLRGIHRTDILILITATQSAPTQNENTSLASLVTHPASEPRTQAISVAVSLPTVTPVPIPTTTPEPNHVDEKTTTLSLVITSRVTITPSSAMLGEALGGSFIIQNTGSESVFLDQLVLGGRLNEVYDCSNYVNGVCPDFTKRYNITIESQGFYIYVGSFTPQLTGTYDFQVFYCINRCDSADDWKWNVASNPGVLNQKFVEIREKEVSWENLADKWANYYDMENRLLKAVVEAESIKNVAGDYDENGVPHAFGYGQIWPKWHYANIQKALLDATGSSVSTTDEQILGNRLLSSNDASMASAALVVRDMWIAIGSPTTFDYSSFETFTKKYVGPAISENDLARRWNIWKKYFP